MGHGHTGTLKNPGSYKISSNWNVAFLIMVVIGLGTFLTAVGKDPSRAWASFLINHFYFLSLAVGGLAFAVIQWVTSAMWSAPVRRIAESFTYYLPVGLVCFGVLYFGIHELYHWSHADVVNHDVILKGKSGYLNVPFFVIRNVVAILIWILFAKKFIGNSIKQDTTKDVGLTQINKTWAPIFLILFAVTFTLTSFDLLMSLDPHWFSTMFGVYCFAGLMYSTHALLTILTLFLKNKGHLEGLVNDNHLHDLGKFLFTFVVFWTYIAFSQFMLIWYANIPEETSYFMRRFHEGWMAISIFLLIGKFVIPFLVLLPRGAKRNPNILLVMAFFMLASQWVDVLWMVQPEFFENGPKIGWVEIGTFLGFAGLFLFSIFRFLGRNSVVAIGDPKLEESVFHHHQ